MRTCLILLALACSLVSASQLHFFAGNDGLTNVPVPKTLKELSLDNVLDFVDKLTNLDYDVVVVSVSELSPNWIIGEDSLENKMKAATSRKQLFVNPHALESVVTFVKEKFDETIIVRVPEDIALVNPSTLDHPLLVLVDPISSLSAEDFLSDTLDAVADLTSNYVAIAEAVPNSSRLMPVRTVQSRVNNEDGYLLERYSFFSPGIWMGIIVSFILLSILVWGVAFLTTLQTPTKFEEKH
eukprot:NODE_1216_length_951_cov_99.018204_g1170_i0.p1 GENE.NODE_1216_length_951_cov_99.018204_g1170_i0~~NODE_1216_length_951_cov_99.018204_g1170_i0.p1  ORF type:complete len:240 (+),score=52.80 NODE_1216_length_951_cov_99.018204_g1170_i0:137-856(+)